MCSSQLIALPSFDVILLLLQRCDYFEHRSTTEDHHRHPDQLNLPDKKHRKLLQTSIGRNKYNDSSAPSTSTSTTTNTTTTTTTTATQFSGLHLDNIMESYFLFVYLFISLFNCLPKYFFFFFFAFTKTKLTHRFAYT